MSELRAFNKFLKQENAEKEKELINEAWFYPRVSSKNQFENNDSIENQNKVCYAYAKKNNIKITKVFGGTFESAKGDFTRKEFMRLINEVKRSRKRPKYILIYIMSRFSRTGGNAISLANMLVEDLGVHLVETSSGLSTETDIGKMSIYQKLLEARKETMSRLDSILPGMRNALSNGKWIGAVPLGYTKYGQYVSEKERFAPETRIEVNETGKALKLAWKLKRRGERDIYIIQKMKTLGVDITMKQIHKMWKKPFYAGVLIHNLIDKPVKGDWEALVSEEDFIYINNKINENKRNSTEYKKERIVDPRPLNGDVYCSECGFKLSGYVRRKKVKTTGKVNEIHYYKCFKCGAVHINANSTKYSKSEGLHNQFIEILAYFIIDKKVHQPISIQLKKLLNSQNKEIKKLNSAAKKKITELKTELEAIELRFATGKIPEKLYDKFTKQLSEEIYDLEKELSGVGNATSNLSKKVKTVINDYQNLCKIWESGCFETKKKIQKLIFPKGMLVDAKTKQLRTQDLNRLIHTITTFSDNCGPKKKGTTNVKIDKSPFAEREGFEPPEV